MQPPIRSRFPWAVSALLAFTGLVLGGNGGQLPKRAPADADAVASQGLAPDLALYCEVISDVRAGRDYYDSARERIPQYGFPIASPLNWRLPTYAWLLSCLPCAGWIQLTLLALSTAALALAFAAQSRLHSFGVAAISTFFLFGVVRWALDGHAYLAQEPWSATLILISLAAYSLGWDKAALAADGPPNYTSPAANSLGWRGIAIAAGLAALFVRELALPYCLVATVLALWHRRWVEFAVWAGGIGLFFAFFAWHVGQVQAQVAAAQIEASTDLHQWIRFGGLDFVLLTTRMNSLLFSAPGWLLWFYLLATLIGLSRTHDPSSQLACLTSLAFLLAFAFLGRPENFYWGLLPAPLFAWGLPSVLTPSIWIQTTESLLNYAVATAAVTQN
jgi:hypothetical protein